MISTSHDIFKDKETYIMHRWSIDFPVYSDVSYNDVSSLSSRSTEISSWFRKVSDEFVLYREAPSWFLEAGKDASDWTKEIQDKYVFVKQLNKEYTQEMNKISLDSKKKMAILDEKHKERLVSELESCPELVFELMNTQMLPIEVHFKSFEYKTKEEAKEFLNKELLLFKENKYKDFLEGAITSSELVSLLFEK